MIILLEKVRSIYLFLNFITAHLISETVRNRIYSFKYSFKYFYLKITDTILFRILTFPLETFCIMTT